MWYYLPSTSSASAPAAECSTAAFMRRWSEQASPLAPFATSSGTPTQRPPSWPGWKRRTWITRLSGLTCDPSTADAGADAFTASLPESPAKETASPGSDCSKTTRATSGQTPGESCGIWDATFSFWKTYEVSLFPTERPEDLRQSHGYLESWPTTGGTRNGTWFRRATSNPITSGSGFGCWPTADTARRGTEPLADLKERLAGVAGGSNLAAYAEAWPREWHTPTTTNAQGNEYTYDNGDKSNPRLTLSGQASNWPTPNANPEAPNTGTTRENGREAARLTDQCLGRLAANFPPIPWLTPLSSDDGRKATMNPEAGQQMLMKQVQRFPPVQPIPWGTPSSRDHKDGSSQESDVEVSGLLGRQVWTFPPSPLLKTTTPDGSGYSALIQLLCRLFGVQSEAEFRAIPKALNPLFVEFLMGWPKGWSRATSLSSNAPTGCGSAGTASSGKPRRKRTGGSGVESLESEAAA
jgi:hypothetical protein